MKKNKVIVRTGLSKKGAQYEMRKARQLFNIVVGLFAIFAFVWACVEPASGHIAGYGVSLASMTLIGSIDDVTDRDTHGSEIAYQVVLIATDQLADKFNFPQPALVGGNGANAGANSRVVTLSKSILRSGEAAHYFEAHTIPTLLSNTEKGDVTTTGTNTFIVVMGGDRTVLKNFVEEYAGGKFIILYKHIKDTVWHIIGEAERPMILNNTEMKDDADGRYVTFTFTRNSVYLDNLVDFGNNGSIQDLLTGNTTT